MTTESTIFYLTFYFLIEPSKFLPSDFPLPCLPTQAIELTWSISIIHYSYLTLTTLPYTISPTVNPTRLLGNALLTLYIIYELIFSDLTIPKIDEYIEFYFKYSP
jgi:hypothetical protein